MGREVKRVTLDFSWPLNDVWPGFLNPHYVACPDCDGGGYSASYNVIHEHIGKLLWDRRGDSDAHVAAVTSFLAGRSRRESFLGHDSIDSYSAAKKLGELAGLPDGWHLCSTCKGDAVRADVKEAYEAWERSDPPTGDGWQVWETVSEGSPISPVFETSDALVTWLVSEGYSHAAASRFVEGGWAPSMLMTGGVMLNDIESCAAMSPVSSGEEKKA